eukprot:scaffold11015_cov96-Isochrysis_galbana.AAC.1
MVVRRTFPTVVSGMARPSAPALPRVTGAAEPVSAMGLARLERPPRMAAPLAAPFGAQKRRLEALGCGPHPLPRPPPLRPPPERSLVACGAVRESAPPVRPGGLL